LWVIIYEKLWAVKSILNTQRRRLITQVTLITVLRILININKNVIRNHQAFKREWWTVWYNDTEINAASNVCSVVFYWTAHATTQIDGVVTDLSMTRPKRVFWKPAHLRLCVYALYKSTIDIDIDIWNHGTGRQYHPACRQRTAVCRKPLLFLSRIHTIRYRSGHASMRTAITSFTFAMAARVVNNNSHAPIFSPRTKQQQRSINLRERFPSRLPEFTW